MGVYWKHGVLILGIPWITRLYWVRSLFGGITDTTVQKLLLHIAHFIQLVLNWMILTSDCDTMSVQHVWKSVPLAYFRRLGGSTLRREQEPVRGLLWMCYWNYAGVLLIEAICFKLFQRLWQIFLHCVLWSLTMLFYTITFEHIYAHRILGLQLRRLRQNSGISGILGFI